MTKSFLTRRRSLLSRYFAFLERRSFGDRALFHVALLVFFAALLYVGSALSERYIAQIPAAGGTLVEGIIGTPRFVNPVLATTRTDQDAVALLYSGLMKISPQGELVPDLAESVTLLQNQRDYEIVLKAGTTFHDGVPVTASDVGYTISLIQSPELKSPLRGNWEGVSFTEVDERTFILSLPEAYTPFLENLTVGIMPRHLWSDVSWEQFPFSQLNTEPIGTGPYKIASVKRDTSGLISEYTLAAFTQAGGVPNINNVVLRFFKNEDELNAALTAKDITSTAQLSARRVDELPEQKYTVTELPLPRVFGIFFNQNRSVALRDPAARAALSLVTDREEIVTTVLNGRGIPTNSPVPAGFGGIESEGHTSTTPNLKRVETATATLESGGWNKNDENQWVKEIDDAEVILAVTISTANTPVFDETATNLKEAWESLGVVVAVDQYEQTDLVQAVIRPRSFEALLFGNDLNRSLDLYPFWHSSQRDDPGLNVTQYANIDTDALLETIRTASSTEKEAALVAFNDIITTEAPALFLYTPTFDYVVHNDIETTPIQKVSSPSERFANISEWFIKKERLWPIFR